MNDHEKSKEELLEELVSMRRSVEGLKELVGKLAKEDASATDQPTHRAIFENSLDGILLTALDGRIFDANEAACRMFGRTKEELCRMGRDGVIDATDPRLFEAMRRRRVDGSWKGEVNLRRENGEIFPAEVSTNIFWDVDGNEKTAMIVRDITERKRREEALRKSEALKQAILDGISTNIAFVNDSQEILWANKAAANSVGMLPSQLVGRTCHSLWADAAGPCRDCPTVKAFQTQRSEHTTMITPDGRVWEEKGEPVFDSQGKLLGVVEIAHDITERVETEKTVRQSERKYRILVDNAPIGILVSDTSGKILEVNRACLDVLGSPGPEATKAINMLTFPPLMKAGISEAFSKCMSEAILVRHDTPYLSKWAQESHLRIIIAPMLNEEGIVEGCQAVIENITERKNLEAQIIQSQKMQAVGTLAAGIAHDFNNMLQIILGYADMLLLDKERGQPEYDSLQKIIKTAHDARDLVQKIRVFSRKADIQPVPLDLNQQVDHVAKLLEHTLPRKIRLNTRLADDLAIINADPGLMEQMVMNLGINAGEAMPDGGSLTFETQNIVLDEDFCRRNFGLKPGLHVLLTVSDTGRGIEKEFLDKIFDPFYSTKKRDYHRGTGLGLPVVRGIVDLHHGHINVESEVGRGTIFRIYFAAFEAAAASKSGEEDPLPIGGTETILLVEDEEVLRNLGKDVLEQFGYKVFAVEDGEEAIKMYKKEHRNIDLVILDVIMPRMDGRQCLRELLKLNPKLKVVVSSGIVEDDLIRDIVAMGAKGSLMKPFDITTLLGKVRQILDAD